MSTNILQLSPNVCPYIGLEIPLHGHSNSTAMFLCLPPVSSTLGIPQGNTFFFGEMTVLISPENRQFGSHPNPLKLEPQLHSHSLTLATLNRYSRIYDAADHFGHGQAMARPCHELAMAWT